MSTYNIKLVLTITKDDGTQFMDSTIDWFNLPYEAMVFIEGKQVDLLNDLRTMAQEKITSTAA